MEREEKLGGVIGLGKLLEREMDKRGEKKRHTDRVPRNKE